MSILLAFSVWRQTYMLMHGAYESQQRLILVSLQNAVMSKVRQEDVVKLTQQLIKISSVNPPGQYQEIVGFLEGKLKELGMRSEIVASDPNRPNVLGWLRKDEGKKFLLIGHTDTVPVTEKEMNNWSKSTCWAKALTAFHFPTLPCKSLNTPKIMAYIPSIFFSIWQFSRFRVCLSNICYIFSSCSRIVSAKNGCPPADNSLTVHIRYRVHSVNADLLSRRSRCVSNVQAQPQS